MADKKIYTIEINGVKESANAVESLNKQLNELENRIKKLENSSVKVNATSSGGGGSRSTSAMDEEAKLAKQIEQIDAKREAYSKEIYQNYLAAKDVLDETVKDQKQIAASERLQAHNYTNTMAGLKQELADIKTVINTTDLGDEAFGKMTQRANEITTKLKELDATMGQFGRDVGNYDRVGQGLDKLKINIGGVTSEFDNARQALRELKGEMRTLSVKKDMGLISEEEVERLKGLIPVVAQLESSIKDAGKPMDALMDTMQSFVAITQATKGLGAFFGLDNAEIDKTIKNLVALQNAMQGLQTIQKQIQERQGIGAWIAPFNVGIDKATAKLLTFNTALLGTGKAAKIATISIKAFSKALKIAFTAGVLIVVDLLVDGLMSLAENFKKVDKAAERELEVQKDLAEAYGQAQGKLIQYKSKVDSFNGSKKEEKKLVEELNKEFGSTLGTYKSLAEWQDVLKKKGEAYIQTLINQAKVQAALNEVTAAYMNLEDVKQKAAKGEYSHWYQSRQQNAEAAERAVKGANKRIEKAEEKLRKTIEANDNYAKSHGIGNYAPQIEKNADKSKSAIEEEQRILSELQLRLMKDGLNKKLLQLDEEERQTLNKLKENGRKNADAIKKIERAYAELRKKEVKEYLKTLEESVKTTARELSNVQFDLNLRDINNEIGILQNKLDELGKDVPKNMTLSSREDFKNILGKHSKFEYAAVRQHNLVKKFADENNEYKEYYSYMYKYISHKNEEIKAKFYEIYDITNGSDAEKKKAQYNYAESIYQEEFKDILTIIRDYGEDITNAFDVLSKNETSILANSFKTRLKATNEYWRDTKELIIKNLKEQSKLKEKAIREDAEKEYDAERERYRKQYNSLSGQAASLESDISGFTPKNDEEEKSLNEMKKRLDEVYAQMEVAAKQHATKMAQIDDEMRISIKKNTISTNEQISSEEEKYFDTRLSDYRDFMSKLNDELSRNPVTDKAGFGIVNWSQTKKNYEEILSASETAIKGIKIDKDRLDSLYKEGFIEEEAYNSTLRQLNELEKDIKNGMAMTTEASKNLVGDFIASLNQYIQALGESFSQIMTSIWNAQDVQFDKEQEELDKMNEELDKKLDEQQDIIEKHKDAIDSIEEELATARGDRRQHLIDQLNAEMAAQRAARAEEKRLQKEKENAEKKQDKLDEKRKKAQYHRDKTQAIVSGALAVVNALATKPFVPTGLAMAALAAATTAAQIAIMSANKPYAKGGQLDGGVAQGKRHRDGGIPVLGGKASIEGGEYITNRVTTSKNVELLDYINSKKKKIDISDLMDFYSTNPRKVIRTVRTKFEDGGYLPTIPNELDIKDQLQNIVVNQDNRPIYVSVVDINNKQDEVRRVQTLAGM